MIDLHCHLLPGIDDGPRTPEEAVELARAFTAAGITTAVATPHVSWTYRNDSEVIARGAESLRAQLRESGIALEVRDGAEIALTRAGDLPDEELARLGLGKGRWLLTEPPLGHAVAAAVAEGVTALARRGHEILLAHPERCPAFHRDPRALRELAGAGVLMSLTASSFSGAFGRTVQRFARTMAAEGLVHNVVSDAHDPRRRPPAIGEGIRAAGLQELAPWLTEEVPTAILDGEPIPERPRGAAPAQQRGGLAGRLGRRGGRAARELRERP